MYVDSAAMALVSVFGKNHIELRGPQYRAGSEAALDGIRRKRISGVH
jgi:hypothetical protein